MSLRSASKVICLGRLQVTRRKHTLSKSGLDGRCREFHSKCLLECDPAVESESKAKAGYCPLKGYPGIVDKCDDGSKSKSRNNLSNLKDRILMFINQFMVHETEFPPGTVNIQFDYS